MAFSFAQLIVILVLVLVLFGAGKLPNVMSDLGKGLKAFKKASSDDYEDKDENNKN